MRGPWSFASQEWGLEIEGHDRRPVIMAPITPIIIRLISSPLAWESD